VLLQHPVLATALHRLAGDFLLIAIGQHNDRDTTGGQKDPVEAIHALAIGQIQVEQDGIDSSLEQTRDARGKTALPDHHEQTIAGLCDGVTNRSADGRIVADEEHFFPGSVHRRIEHTSRPFAGLYGGEHRITQPHQARQP